MNDTPPSRLELLRFARRVVVQQATAALAQLDRWIADEQRRESERRRADEMRPPPPEWLVERGLNKSNLVAVHAGECWVAARNDRCVGASRAQALDALRRQVPACPHCRPDTALGFLE
ncbi:DUF6233 domain-containing protein [Streptomyces chromofuscus]|uniref:Uncharacterized protein n=1 Tax=Streptomyces chromofuscus TaxID=42881 RepID=A0A7M2T611_STRCW|nr:DUF6233 domain-containing protein [Streptomyces chromofuscus]QOV43323.1 hypothetical protein IPT68_26750 [Streptomyces chromofuscus]GGT29437.1 hypothetical protein GCM10010254_57600 [Streptomyces chromofuscus]